MKNFSMLPVIVFALILIAADVYAQGLGYDVGEDDIDDAHYPADSISHHPGSHAITASIISPLH